MLHFIGFIIQENGEGGDPNRLLALNRRFGRRTSVKSHTRTRWMGRGAKNKNKIYIIIIDAQP